MIEIERYCTTQVVTITGSTQTTSVIPSQRYAGGSVFWAGSTSATLTFHAAVQPGGAVFPMTKPDGSAVTASATASNVCVQLPDECYGVPCIVITASAGTPANATVFLKG
jgi:hypothetical protein